MHNTTYISLMIILTFIYCSNPSALGFKFKNRAPGLNLPKDVELRKDSHLLIYLFLL